MDQMQLNQNHLLISQHLQDQVDEAMYIARQHSRKVEVLKAHIEQLNNLLHDLSIEKDTVTAENDDLCNDIHDAIGENEEMNRKLVDMHSTLKETERENEWLRTQKERLEEQVEELLILLPNNETKNFARNGTDNSELALDIESKPLRVSAKQESPSFEQSKQDQFRHMCNIIRRSTRERAEVEESCKTLEKENRKLNNLIVAMDKEKKEALDCAKALRSQLQNPSTSVRSAIKASDSTWIEKMMGESTFAKNVVYQQPVEQEMCKFQRRASTGGLGGGGPYPSDPARHRQPAAVTRSQVQRRTSDCVSAPSENVFIKLFGLNTDLSKGQQSRTTTANMTRTENTRKTLHSGAA